MIPSLSSRTLALALTAAFVLAALPSTRALADPPSLRAAFLYAVADTTEHDAPFRSVPLEDPWLAPDKGLHASAGFLIALSSQYVFTSKAQLSERGALPLSFGAVVLAGLAKELHDHQRPVRPFFSWRDLVATAAGGAAAALVILL